VDDDPTGPARYGRGVDAETSQDSGTQPGTQRPEQDAAAQPPGAAAEKPADAADDKPADEKPARAAKAAPVRRPRAAKPDTDDASAPAEKAAAEPAKPVPKTPPGPDSHPLVAEVMKKAPLVWLEIAGHGASPAWCLWIDGALYIVSGPGEQPVPGLADSTRVDVVVRSADTLARIVRWPAAVSQVQPGTEEWEASAAALLAKRLNVPDAERAVARWASTCAISRLEPAGDPDELGSTLPATGHRAAPPTTPAATRTTVPYTVGRGRGRRRQH
jgi:hypothetical protein